MGLAIVLVEAQAAHIFAVTVICRDVAQSPIDLHSAEYQTRQDGRKRIAIVGGGIAAASPAHPSYADYGYPQPIDLTIYEVGARVGGRVNSTLVDNLAYTYGGYVDTGASTFSANDWCLQTAIDDTRLRREVIKECRHISGLQLAFRMAKLSSYVEIEVSSHGLG
ncbi:uncharacterized protein BDR25DRAFT_347654 [Lindgomyces ingoldianus]|uniref:Uncharacterized protein n=1 Tax=Lindgomyces ingoldianus TaxID=673940 RepID=A0ACB6Q715_9PLEO|nr:uncharacterized protein BDR25DRAFT_347654 [Lindgomyces ingoldianus]KAF2462673.1 hypothetical protein BDR25DRAFT_347654 [Lindgomyces ingoldianus]